MTPKEKAADLVEKYSPLVTTWDCYWDTPVLPEIILRDAKKCAVIAIDEILKACDAVYDSDLVHFMETGDGEFWLAVKKEVEALA